jgi:nucleoside-diphosphate-sugar epimerase
VLELERLVTQTAGFEGIVLRYGLLYGPGTSSDTPASPISVEVGAAARAALLAVERGAPGLYNVVDDEGPVSNARARSELGWRP